jgi:hypothetical protein
MNTNLKTNGFSVRCTKDTVNPDNGKVGKIYEGAKAIETAFISGDVISIINILTDNAKELYSADLSQVKKSYLVKFGEAFKTRVLKVYSDLYAEFNYTKDGIVFSIAMAIQEDGSWKLMRL